MITKKVTREQFNAYRKVQFSGITNMWMISKVKELSGLSGRMCFDIMKSYEELKLKYGKYKEV